MCRFLIPVMFVFFFFQVKAQPRPATERRLQLLKQLRITALQRAQIQQLIQEEKMQELLRNKRLQQILTPEQLKKLEQFKKENNPSRKDSLNYRKIIP